MTKTKIYRDGSLARAGASVRRFFGLSSVKDENDLINHLNDAEKALVTARKQLSVATAAHSSLHIDYISVCLVMGQKLNAIIALETPKANSASRKMAAIARDARKQLESPAEAAAKEHR